MPDAPDHADRLRQEIDRGHSGDKVNFRDPAAAPLGTDDEAAGTPLTKEQVRAAHRAEVRERPSDASTGRPDRTIGDLQTCGMGSGTWVILGICVVLVLLAVAVAFA